MSYQATREAHTYSRAKGVARMVLVALADLRGSGDRLVAVKVGTLADMTNMSPRHVNDGLAELQELGELECHQRGGGRGKPTVWHLVDLRDRYDGEPFTRSRRAPAPKGQRPLVNPAPRRSVSEAETVQPAAGFGAGNPALNPAAQRARVEKRLGEEKTTPLPPTAAPLGEPTNGRRRGLRANGTNPRALEAARQARDAAAALRPPTADDVAAWEHARAELRAAVPEDLFAIWLEPLTLGAVAVSDGALVALAPPTHRAWLTERFTRVLDGVHIRCATAAEHDLLQTTIHDLTRREATG